LKSVSDDESQRKLQPIRFLNLDLRDRGARDGDERDVARGRCSEPPSNVSARSEQLLQPASQLDRT